MLRDEQKAQAELMKEKPFSERLSYFFHYNKYVVLAALLGVCLIAYIIYTVSTFSTDNLYVMITDQQGKTLDTEVLTEAWNDFLASSNASKLPIIYTADLELANTTLSNVTVTDLQKVLALYNANTIDVMIAPETVFLNYGSEGMFQDLTKVLSKEETDLLSADNRFLTITSKITGETFPMAFHIPDAKLVSASGMVIDDVCIGLTVKQSHPVESIQFLKLFLF